MSSQKLAVLAVVAAGMVLWAAVLTRKSGSTGPQGNVPTYLVQGLAIDKINAIEIGTDENKVVLKRQGQAFVAANKDNYPVSVKQINELLTKCLDIKTMELVSENAQNHADLGVTVDKARTVIRFLQADGEVITGIVVGNPPEGSPGSYIRLINGDQVYSVSQAPWFQDQIINYLDRELLKIEKDDIHAVTITDPNRSFTLKLGPDGEGIELAQLPAGKNLKSTDARSVLTTLTSLRFDDVKKGPDAQLKFDRTYVAKLSNDTLYILKIAKSEDKTYAIVAAEYTGGQVTMNPNAKDSEAELLVKEEKLKAQTTAMTFTEKHKSWIYEIPEWKAQYLTKALDDLLEDLPEPVETSEVDPNATQFSMPDLLETSETMDQ